MKSRVSPPDQDFLSKLQAENARLIALLESRENKTTGESGYAPACANEWRAGICEKPRIKCSDCPNRAFLRLSDAVIYGHLAGEYTVGVYPLLEGDSCCFLAVDFDEAEWRDDARAFMQSCEGLGVPAALEISRSGQGAHAWVFFAGRISARDARRLGTAIISHTCARTRQLQLKSYDRLFPNQDTMPKGGFGNLIALPLQKGPPETGCTVFVDAELRPYPDQWAYLAVVRPMDAHDIEPTILRATGGAHLGDAAGERIVFGRLALQPPFESAAFAKRWHADSTGSAWADATQTLQLELGASSS